MVKIYVASKTKHAEGWRFVRKIGMPIISTWIDEAGVGESPDLSDLWIRCIKEASECDILVVYREPEEVLKGAWAEVGAALAHNKQVFAVGIDEFTIANHPNITSFSNMSTLLMNLQYLHVKELQ